MFGLCVVFLFICVLSQLWLNQLIAAQCQDAAPENCLQEAGLALLPGQVVVNAHSDGQQNVARIGSRKPLH